MGAATTPPRPVPSPKSPPRYPDFCGKHRLQVEVQIFNREIGFLEEELQSLDDLQPASKCCKEVNEFVGARPDPLIPINRGKSEPCCISWAWKKLCASLSRICCCGSTSSKPKRSCSCSCSLPKNCFTCSPCSSLSKNCCTCSPCSSLSKNCCTCSSCSLPKIECRSLCCPFPLSCQTCSGGPRCRRRRRCRCPDFSCTCSCPNCFRFSKNCCLGCCFCP